MSKRKAPAENENSQFCDFLHELAEYEKNINRNLFKYKAYRKASSVLASHPVKITSGSEAKKLPGIGVAIAKKIDEFIKTGKLEKLEKIKADDSNTVITLLTRVSGIGPVAAKKLAEDGVKNLQDLKNIEEKLSHHQKIGLKYFSDLEERIPRSEMESHKEYIDKEILFLDKDFTVTICGSYRRGSESSGDIDVLLTHPGYISKSKKCKKLQEVVAHLQKIQYITDSISLGASKFMGVCKLPSVKSHRRIDLRIVPHDQYYCGVLYFTGSDVFNQQMRLLAMEKGFSLNEYSIRFVGATGNLGEPLPVTSEKDVFDIIGMPYVAPCQRNG